ncbi:MAG: LacI family DNA-binding transcriptional regulator, partial [Bacteroidota bacterium]
MSKKVTIHDLAKVLGINSSTVSRALNNSPKVGEDTKEKVWAKAKELGYQRNLLAANLRKSVTMTIGVVVPFISRKFFNDVIDGIERMAREKNYRIIITQSHDDVDLEKEAIEGLFMNRIDGLLISPSFQSETDTFLSQYYDNNIPVVVFDRYFKKSKLPRVTINDRGIANDLTEHVIKTGKKKVFNVIGNLSAEMYKERNKGYLEAMENNGLMVDDSYVKSIELNSENGVQLLKEILADKDNIPDAIICGNDVTAIGMMSYLDKNTDLRVPEDISIAGFSNEPASEIIKPALTTVNQHALEIGRVSCAMVLKMIEEKSISE